MTKTVSPEFWRGKRVFLTGHTGFKGTWLTLWLHDLGAKVCGYSLAPNTAPSMYELTGVRELLEEETIGDICDAKQLTSAVLSAKPDVIFHLAAQAIVSEGYENPAKTFETNVMGVVNLLEAVRQDGRDIPTLVVSSDKCYENQDTGRAFQIDDPLGGKDPYSASKAGTEIVTSAYRSSYFSQKGSAVLGSARAGNVVGGGDWSADRLLSDAARAFSTGQPLRIRNPKATRPWQHVVEPLYGYMMLIEAMSKDRSFGRPWNFGPLNRNHAAALPLAQDFAAAWGKDAVLEISTAEQDWKEATSLNLDCSQTLEVLRWRPALDLKTTAQWTANWYSQSYQNSSKDNLRKITLDQIKTYEQLQRRST